MNKIKEFLNNVFPLIPYDKKLHFLAGLIICILFSIINDPITGIGGAICAGIAKECYDDHIYGGFDWQDMVMTWVGGCVGFTLFALVKYFAQ